MKLEPIISSLLETDAYKLSELLLSEKTNAQTKTQKLLRSDGLLKFATK